MVQRLGPSKTSLQNQADRVAVIAKVKPAVVAIFAKGGQGGGTGVLISADGFALTNFHVVQPTGPTMQCGLPDGVLYDAVLVGLDKVGDVALIKLLPKKEGAKFPAAILGDSRHGSRRRLVDRHGQSVSARDRFQSDRHVRPGLAEFIAINTPLEPSWNTPIAFRSTPPSIPATPAARSST